MNNSIISFCWFLKIYNFLIVLFGNSRQTHRTEYHVERKGRDTRETVSEAADFSYSHLSWNPCHERGVNAKSNYEDVECRQRFIVQQEGKMCVSFKQRVCSSPFACLPHQFTPLCCIYRICGNL